MEFDDTNWRSEVCLAPIDAAYIAGLIDGEGTLTIVRSKRPDRRLGWQYQPCFSIANTDLALLRSVQRTCGNGRVQRSSVKPALHKQGYQLKFWAEQTRQLLPQVLPYLRGKAEQARVLLSFLAHTQKGSGEAKPEAYWDEVERLRTQISNLNRRGHGPNKEPIVGHLRPSRSGVNQWTRTSA